MKTLKLSSLRSFLLIVLLFLCACGSDGDDLGNDGNGASNKLVGTKWTTSSWDFSAGDDWAVITEERYNVYFRTSTEGILYYGRKDNDSDFGSSMYRKARPFKYKFYENKIILESLIDPLPSSFEHMDLKDGLLWVNGLTLEKGFINHTDEQWFGTLTGKTGQCTWFYDLVKTLCIYGKGDMGNYASFSQTPWAQNDQIPNQVALDEGVTSVGAYAFANPSIGYVELPESLTRIGEYAFSGTSLSRMDIPDHVKVIDKEAFSRCKYLSAYMSNEIEEIGEAAFCECKQISLSTTPYLRKIGNMAFFNTKLTVWTNSQVLEEVGDMAVSDSELRSLELPNSLKHLGSFAFSSVLLKNIRIGTGLEEVVGTPFEASYSGTVYVNKNKPIKLTYSLVNPKTIDRWTLVVPKGSKNAYASVAYWCNFGKILEDGTLGGDGTDPDDDNGGNTDPDDGNTGGDDNLTSKVTTYWLDGVRHHFIKVEGGPTRNLYVMETELPHRGDLRIGDVNFNPVDANADDCVFKTEFRNYLSKLREKTGAPLRLLTFEEWKYIASGGNKSHGYLYSGSNSIDKVAWYKNNSSNHAHQVAEKEPNELGFYDLCGNYEELVNDTEDIFFIDGRQCGGSWNDPSNYCKVTSWREGQDYGRIPGTNFKHKNAYDSRYVAIRLAFDLPNE